MNSDAVSKSCLCSIKEQSKIFLHLSSSLCLPASSAGMKVTVASYFQDLHSSVLLALISHLSIAASAGAVGFIFTELCVEQLCH